MRACFGDMVLVAGAAKIGRKGLDGWKPEYEGGAATLAELSRPHFAMADATGSIYIADKDADAIRKVTPEGAIITLAGRPELSAPNGLWARGDGVVYVLDLGHAAIKRLDTAGTSSTLFEVPGGISIGRGLWVSADETLAYLASNTRVLSWTPTEGVQRYADGFRSLGNLAMDGDGALVVTDRGAGLVLRIDAKGSKTIIAGNGKDSGGGDGFAAVDTAMPGVRAIWFDRTGGYFVGTHESSTIWFVDPEGIVHRFLGEPEVSEVRGLSQDEDGNLIVVDHDGGRVWRLSRKG